MVNPLFIPAGNNLKNGEANYLYFISLSKDEIKNRWKTNVGLEIKKLILSKNFDREFLLTILGRVNDKIDLRGIDLSQTDLLGIDLSNIDFFASTFKKTNLTKCNLSNSFLSECDIRGANFSWSNLKNTFLDNVLFDKNTTFIGVNINELNFNLAILIYDLVISQQRIAHLKSKNPFLALILRMTTDYGRSLFRWAIWCVGAVLLYSFLFYYFSGDFKPRNLTFLDCTYYSIITFTTLGYGDILPSTPFAKILAISEVCLGYIMGGLLIAILTKKVMG